MNLIEDKQKLSTLLEKLAETIDLTEKQYKDAVTRYEAVGAFLSEKGTLLARYKPHIKPQGSMRIGTTTRPILAEDKFDVDLTCVLEAYPYPAKQKLVKNLIKQRLEESPNYKRMLGDEKRRCWRLEYAEETAFHLDIVPAIPDNYGWLLDLGVSEELAKHAITITDTEHDGYEKYLYAQDIPKSNTEGYALWFLTVMKEEADRIRLKLKDLFKLSKIEDVPEYRVRTPLQRGIQLMKRHRDIRFSGNQANDFKPVSIIITTLAARAYEKVIKAPRSNMFYDILMQMVEEMPNFIKNPEGKYWIPNPTNPSENFADKWNEEKSILYATTFHQWHNQLRRDLSLAFSESKDIQDAADRLKKLFGDKAVLSAIKLTAEKPTTNFLSLLTPTINVNPEIAHKQKPLWQIDLQGSVSISASYKTPYGRDYIDLTKERLPKNAHIKFYARTNIQPPFNVYWQVVNTGREAQAANCLRGEIFAAHTAGIGGIQHFENTLYYGNHSVECFIIKNGKCVAKSGEFPVQIN